MRLALLHPRRQRPWNPGFQTALDDLQAKLTTLIK